MLPLCRDILWNNGVWRSSSERINKLVLKTGDAEHFKNYFTCLDKFSAVTRFCARKHLDTPCHHSQLRVVKTVRAPMEVAVQLVRHNVPALDLKLVYLLRDPRGVARSRTISTWSWGNGERNTPLDHSSRYCLNAIKDYKLMTELSRTHPYTGMLVVYDGFMVDPVHTTEMVYRHVGKPVAQSTLAWVSTALKVKVPKNGPAAAKAKHMSVAKGKVNSTMVAASWKRFFTVKQLQEVEMSCKEFFRMVKYPWV